MGKSQIFIFILAIMGTMCLSSCKTEFEKIRQGNDPEVMLKKGLELYDAAEYEKAQILLEQAISAYRGQKEAEELFFKYAYTHYHLNQFILAAHYFKNFANTFINSEKREEADFMAAYSNVRNSPTFRLDQTYTKQGIEGLETFVNSYPKSETVQECNE